MIWLCPNIQKTEVDFQKNIGKHWKFGCFSTIFPPFLLEKSENPGEFGDVPPGPRTSAAPNSWH
jgi:hypothetical protein